MPEDLTIHDGSFRYPTIDDVHIFADDRAKQPTYADHMNKIVQEAAFKSVGANRDDAPEAEMDLTDYVPGDEFFF